MKKNKKTKQFQLPPISAYSSQKEWEVACWDIISGSKKLLKLFIAPQERHNIVLRVAAMEKIYIGESYRQISKEFSLSLQTVSSIKKALNEKEYQSYAEWSKKNRKGKKYSSYLPKEIIELHRIGKKRVHTKYGTKYISISL